MTLNHWVKFVIFLLCTYAIYTFWKGKICRDFWNIAAKSWREVWCWVFWISISSRALLTHRKSIFDKKLGRHNESVFLCFPIWVSVLPCTSMYLVSECTVRAFRRENAGRESVRLVSFVTMVLVGSRLSGGLRSAAESFDKDAKDPPNAEKFRHL